MLQGKEDTRMSEQASRVANKAIPEWAEGLYYNSGIMSEILVYHDDESIYIEHRGKESGIVRFSFEMLEGLKIVEDEGEHEDGRHWGASNFLERCPNVWNIRPGGALAGGTCISYGVGLSAIRAAAARHALVLDDLALKVVLGLNNAAKEHPAVYAGVRALVLVVVGCCVEGIASWRYPCGVHSPP
jgi:hypothetical protein